MFCAPFRYDIRKTSSKVKLTQKIIFVEENASQNRPKNYLLNDYEIGKREYGEGP